MAKFLVEITPKDKRTRQFSEYVSVSARNDVDAMQLAMTLFVSRAKFSPQIKAKVLALLPPGKEDFREGLDLLWVSRCTKLV